MSAIPYECFPWMWSVNYVTSLICQIEHTGGGLLKRDHSEYGAAVHDIWYAITVASNFSLFY